MRDPEGLRPGGRPDDPAVAGLVLNAHDVSGQTLPSPYWLTDDVQYFPPGTEFKLSREAAAMQADADAMQAGGGAAPAPPAPGPVMGGAPAPMPPAAVPIQ